MFDNSSLLAVLLSGISLARNYSRTIKANWDVFSTRTQGLCIPLNNYHEEPWVSCIYIYLMLLYMNDEAKSKQLSAKSSDAVESIQVSRPLRQNASVHA